ncbi:unnamed protein product [Prunus armeniaca]
MEINTLFAENGGRRREIERWENSVKTGELAAVDSRTAVRWRGRVGSFGNGLEDRGGVWRWLWRLGMVAVEENSKGEGYIPQYNSDSSPLRVYGLILTCSTQRYN